MVVCKIQCPQCGTDHEVPFDQLNSASMLECNICGNEFALTNETPSNEPKQKQKTRKTQKSLKPSPSSMKKRPTRKASSHRKKSGGTSSSSAVTMCIVGLVLILGAIGGFKALKSKQNSDAAKAHNEEVKAAAEELNTTNVVKNEIAELKKQLLAQNAQQAPAAGSGAAAKATAEPVEKTPENVVLANYSDDEAPQLEEAEVTVEDAPAFAQAQTQVEEEKPAMKKKMSSPEEPTAEKSSASKTVPTSTLPPSSKMILTEAETRDLEELSQIPSFKLTAEETETLKELKSKYQWYKANRYKMTRDEMDEAWERRWAEIVASNDVVRSRRDAMLPRPLQILLEGAKTTKERAYMMRIFQRPVSFEEKELVRKARNQALWERRKQEGPKRYPEDAKKKKNQKYVDEYGYEYYLDDKGQRIYL